MDSIFSLVPPGLFVLCLMVALVAGVIKGMVGFAMPMIMISGLGSIVGPELALAGLILPTLLTNGWQALRQGWPAVVESVKRFRVFLIVGFVALVSAAQLVRAMPDEIVLLLIGVPIVVFAATQLMGIPLRLPPGGSPRIEAAVALAAGFMGGISGVWGPPTVAYLTALDTPKKDQVRIQGVLYSFGAFALLGAHIASGIIRPETMPFSFALMIPAGIGMLVGFWVQDRIDQAAFRKATLIVLLVAGGNLIRRAVMG